jgi:DNA-binding IclR family transcriptional regulator
VPRPSPQTDRVVAIVGHLADHEEGATLTELATAVGADRSALVHVLAALTTAGVLFREPGDLRYHLGPALVRPGRVAARRYGDHLAAVRAEMQDLADDLDLACLSFEPEGDQGRLAQYVWPRGSEPPAITVGETLPLRPPLGIIFVAWADAPEVDRWLALAPDLAPERRERLLEQCPAIRSLGFVVEARPRTMEDEAFARLIDDRASPRRDGKLLELLADHGHDEHVLTELAGDDRSLHPVHAIGAPCFDADGRVARSLSVIGFTRPLRTDEVHRIGGAVRAAADRATAAVGGAAGRSAPSRRARSPRR